MTLASALLATTLFGLATPISLSLAGVTLLAQRTGQDVRRNIAVMMLFTGLSARCILADRQHSRCRRRSTQAWAMASCAAAPSGSWSSPFPSGLRRLGTSSALAVAVFTARRSRIGGGRHRRAQWSSDDRGAAGIDHHGDLCRRAYSLGLCAAAGAYRRKTCRNPLHRNLFRRSALDAAAARPRRVWRADGQPRPAAGPRICRRTLPVRRGLSGPGVCRPDAHGLGPVAGGADRRRRTRPHGASGASARA